MTIFGIIFLLLLVPGLVQVTMVDAWNTTAPVQAIFPKKVLQTVVAFVPEKDSEPELSSDEANKLAMSVFKDYGLSGRFNEYSSGAITMVGVDSDPIVTVKYLDKGFDTCDRGEIIDAVSKAISPVEPDRLIVVSNTRNATCPGVADGDMGGKVVMVYNLQFFAPNALFHELGHTLSLNHAGTLACYSDHKLVTMSDNCTTENHENFQNMGVISYDQPMFESDGITATNPGVKGIMEYSSYNRLSTLWPMLNETNVLDFTGNGTFTIYNSENSTIGDNPTLVRIPLSSLITNSPNLIDGNVTYHTHYYVDISQRRPNTDEGGLYNYIIIRSAPDHRAKSSMDTLFMTALSTDDESSTTNFFDNMRGVNVTLISINNTSATLDITVPPNYTPATDFNECYFSSVIDDNYVVAVNGTKACRSIGYNDALSVGYFNGTACLTAFYEDDTHVVPPPDVEYLHCTGPLEWDKISARIDNSGYNFWGNSNNLLCKTSNEGTEYLGRGDGSYCFYYFEDKVKWTDSNDTLTTYLKWLSV